MHGLVGVDVGGSGVRASVVEASTGIIDKVWRSPLVARDVDQVVDVVVKTVRRACSHPTRVGVGVPGFVRGGQVLASPNFPAWRGVPLASLLERELHCPVHIENDANAAAFGVWVERGRSGDLVLLTLGTGVGGGVICDGALLRGAGGTGTELGHIYVGGDRRCGCGGVGCLETWASNTGFIALALEYGQSLATVAEGMESAVAGEVWAIEAFERMAEHLGRGLVTLVNMFNPDHLVITGGLTEAASRLRPGAERWLRQHGIQANVDWVRLDWEGRADVAAIRGAALAPVRGVEPLRG